MDEVRKRIQGSWRWGTPQVRAGLARHQDRFSGDAEARGVPGWIRSGARRPVEVAKTSILAGLPCISSMNGANGARRAALVMRPTSTRRRPPAGRRHPSRVRDLDRRRPRIRHPHRRQPITWYRWHGRSPGRSMAGPIRAAHRPAGSSVRAVSGACGGSPACGRFTPWPRPPLGAAPAASMPPPPHRARRAPAATRP